MGGTAALVPSARGADLEPVAELAEHDVPALVVVGALGLRVGSDALPASMLELHARAVAFRREPHLDLGRVALALEDVPREDEAGRRIPVDDSSPSDLSPRSLQTSYTSPPSRGSKTISLTVPLMEWLPTGHQLVASAVNTRNASSTAQSTVTVLRTTSMTRASLMTYLLLVAALGCGLEPREGLVPESVHPFAELRDAGRLQLVQVPRPVAPVRDEPGVLQHSQMLGHGGPAHGKLGCELADGARPRAQALEDLPPRRVAERVERVPVSIHLP